MFMFKTHLLRYLVSSPDGLLWQDPSAGGTAGAGGTTAPPAGGTTTPPAGGTTTPPAGGTTTPPAGTQQPPGGQQFTYPEDRSGWVKPDVHKKAESLVNRTAAELTKLKADLAERDRKIAALAGVTVPSADETEAEKVAAAFYSLPQFAHLKGLTPEFLASVKALVDQGSTFAEARDHLYNQQADRFLASLETTFAEEIGAQSLTPGQARKLRAAFGASMPDQREDPEGFAKFRQRYDAGDESLISEFIKEYVSDMLEPARRQATVPIAQRRPVPRGGPSTSVVTTKQKPDYSKMSLQEMLDHGEKEAESLGR
jgi:hypothetical protein